MLVNIKVVPVGPTISDISPTKKSIRRLSSHITKLHRQHAVIITSKFLSFRDAFGVLGPPMVLVALTCILWTAWLIILTVAPNKTANFLMNTGLYDDGQFWLIPEKLTVLQVFSVGGLVVVAVMYMLVLKILLWRTHRQVETTLFDEMLQHCAPNVVTSPTDLEFSHRARRLVWEIYIFLKELTGFHGKFRKLWTFVLRKMLEEGIPVHIILGFAGFMALNSASCAIAILSGRLSAFSEILIDSLFDLGATVLLPILVLCYCSRTFDYDHDVFLIYLELMPIGSFERRARMFADPSEIELFRVAFDSIRICSMDDLLVRISMNLGFSYRFKRVAEVQIQMRTQRLCVQRKNGNDENKQPTIPTFRSGTRSCQKAIPRSIALIFIAFSVGVLVITQQAITTSQSICRPHPECVVYAYRWRESNFCPCRALVDGNRAPMTYYEWTHSLDATEMVKNLATAGTLETFQLINRQLTVLPDELRNCRDLKFISIVNCAIEELPVWAKEFQNLEFLQIEGKIGSDNLGNLASDLFTNMPELRYLQLGLHQRMTQLPPLGGVPNLCCIILARMSGITELPSFAHVSQLERMEFTVMKQLAWLPDFERIGPVIHFAVYQGAYLCCNGFLGICDLTLPYCKTTTCLQNASHRATPSTLQVFEKFSASVCEPDFGVSQTPTAATIQMCNGIPFRRCSLPGVEPNTTVIGMCYNHRMQFEYDRYKKELGFPAILSRKHGLGVVTQKLSK
ncbi:Hypothetical protein PHPALM_6245 [Phytophthora palmivora]|uniref:WLGC domain-containing protein n=1 Tax=Phytophthora palmivora TaxID=4796 RepID=A0A2P4YFC0_9STRA|nr:Hypothetical protein PHPALM_6245 [Phytophthora palmivora]